MAMTLTESVENYLESILVLQQTSRIVRLKDISRKLGVSMPSAHTALHVLERGGFVCHERYGYVELTKKGRSVAQTIYAAHRALVEFLTAVLGVSPVTAEQEACRMEHVLSVPTLRRLARFTRLTVERKTNA
jgi:Mn-dependent DtxR family transcriptional regulator